MFLIYSSQGENFAAAVFSLMTLIYIFEHYKNSEVPIGTSLKVGVFVSFLCLLHYQTMFFLPGFFIALFYESSYSIRIFSKKWIPSILVAATTVLGIYFIFLKGRLTYNPGIHWNAGESGQYAFNPDCGDGFFGCAFRVFIENLFEVMQSIVSFSNIDETTSLIYTTVILALTVLGFIYIISNKRHRGLFIFLLVGVIVWMALVLMNKLTFSPTRHSLILLSPIALLSSYGFYLIFRNFTKILTSYFSVVLFCIIVLSLFVFAFDEQKEKRGDPLEKVKIENILQKYNPSVIIAYSHSAHLEFYPIVKNNYWSKYINNYPYSTIYKKRVNNENKSRILIFCVNGELCNNSDSEVVSAILMKYFGKNKAYENIYKYEVNSTVLNGFGSKAGSGPNSLFLSIWE